MRLNKDTQSKLYGYVTKKLGMRHYRRDWLRGTCPSCGRSEKFGVSLAANRTNCFVCGYHPYPLLMVKELEGFTKDFEVLSFLKVYKDTRYYEPVMERLLHSNVSFPESYKNITLGENLIARNARKYVEKRGFDVEDKSYKGWGYCSTGDYAGYLIMPFYMMGKLVYYNARRFMGSGPKYNNPKIEDVGIGKSLILYNADSMALYDEVFLVEGVINADTIGDNGIATGGKNISDYQIAMIVKSPIKELTLILDPDALMDSIRVAMLISYHKRVRIITWSGDDDINDIGQEEAMKRVNKVEWMNYNKLLQLKNGTRTINTYN